jgi:hypothetical protein
MRKSRIGAVSLVLLALVAVARAVKEEALENARRLVVEAKPFVEKANDVELAMQDRRTPRKEAFSRLRAAKAAYDEYLDANPAMEETLDQEYVEAMVLLHGIKKDSALGDLEKDDAPSAGATSTPTETRPPEPTPHTLAEVQLAIRAHPGDLPRAQKLYATFLSESTDPVVAECAEAATCLGQVNDRMKTVFRAVAKRDYDALSGSESREERKFVAAVASRLSSGDAAARRRVAGILVATRSRCATPPLARAAFDPDAELARTCREGLVAIGGASVGDSLAVVCRSAPLDRRRTALEILATLAAKGEQEAATQSRAIGAFTLQGDDAVVRDAFKLLVSMGRLGGAGLWRAVLEIDDLDRKSAAMARLAEARYWRGAHLLAVAFLRNPRGDPTAGALFRGATAAIEKMGVHAVPHLADALDGESARGAADLLTKLTGTPVAPGERQKVLDWWASHKPKEGE